MREVTPSISILRIIFTDRCPLPFRNVGSPFLPVLGAFSIFLETLFLLTKVFVVIDDDHLE
jgi:hypothetical protein